jgi:hypothetical protein
MCDSEFAVHGHYVSRHHVCVSANHRRGKYVCTGRNVQSNQCYIHCPAAAVDVWILFAHCRVSFSPVRDTIRVVDIAAEYAAGQSPVRKQSVPCVAHDVDTGKYAHARCGHIHVERRVLPGYVDTQLLHRHRDRWSDGITVWINSDTVYTA